MVGEPPDHGPKRVEEPVQGLDAPVLLAQVAPAAAFLHLAAGVSLVDGGDAFDAPRLEAPMVDDGVSGEQSEKLRGAVPWLEDTDIPSDWDQANRFRMRATKAIHDHDMQPRTGLVDELERRFELAEFADLKSKYAKEFYRRAKQYRSSGIWKISRDEFCRLLGVSDSTAKSTANLNRVVLKTIAEECGPLLGLKIERQYVKRRLSGFVFTFARETPPVIDARPVEARKTDGDGKGHWTSVAGYGEVFTTTELFDVTAARDHFDGTVEAGECRFCAFDARNREHHARNAGRLF